MIDALGSVLAFFYQITHSFGMAIILLTVVVRLLLFPLTLKQTRSMQGMARLQPEVKKLQAEHGSDKQKLNAEMMDLYRREKINPAAGCLPLLLQFPVFFGLYQVIRGLTNTGSLSWLQVQVPTPRHLAKNTEMYRAIIEGGGKLKSFGLNLAESASSVAGGFGSRLPYLLMVLGIAATGFVQQIRANKLNPATTAQAAQMQQIMKILPVGFALFCFQAQAGLVVYWLASNIWTLVQQEVLNKTNPKPLLEGGAPVPYVKPKRGGPAGPRSAAGKLNAAVEAKSIESKGSAAVGPAKNTAPTKRPTTKPSPNSPVLPTKSAKANSKGASKAPTSKKKGR